MERGRGVKADRVALVEGPASEKLPGWSHFWLHVGTRKPAAFLAESNGAALRAVRLGAEFFPRGSWESADRKAALKAWLRGGALEL